MNLESAKAATKLAVHRGLFKTRKHSPVILMIAGIGGMVATTVLASKATLKLEDVVDEMDSKLATAKLLQAQESVEVDGQTVVYTNEEFNRVKALIYIRGGANIAKLYWPAATLGLASIGLIVGGHTILSKRNVGLAAAYAALDKSFSTYRERVVEALGSERERELRRAIISKEEVTDEETGKKVEAFRIDPNGVSIYARFFDEGNKHWEKKHEYNLVFLRATQSQLNDQLRATGHLFLNEVYDALGLPRTTAGQVVGWHESIGDQFVDFGLYDPTNEMAREFVNGYERSILLEFNVAGPIMNLID